MIQQQQQKRPPKRGAAAALSLKSLIWNQWALCNLPILILVIVASLDNADKQLLASSFPVLERTLHLSVETLGYFSLFSNLAYALSLPLWGWLVHRYGMAHIHVLLSAACFSWGLSTVGIAWSGASVAGQATFRALNGVALGSILPLSQTLLVGMVDVSMRGRAFGWMGLCEKLAGTASAASVFYFAHWETSYYSLGCLSMAVAAVAWTELTPLKRSLAKRQSSRRQTTRSGKDNDSDEEMDSGDYNDDYDYDDDDKEDEDSNKLTLTQIVQRIARVPAFICLVAQGIFGGTPWDMMSFMIMLLDWRQFTSEQIVTIQFTTGMAATLGQWFGGLIGDYFAVTFSHRTGLAESNNQQANKGRIWVALVSVIGGIPLYGMFLFAKEFSTALIFTNLFHFVGTWASAAALRPICADLARNPSERAQIVSLWIVLEKTAGAIFGAPLVGYLTGHMMKLKQDVNIDADVGANVAQNDNSLMEDKAQALAWNLFVLSTLFWSICSCFWVAMAFTIDTRNSKPDDTDHHHQQQKHLELAMHRKDSDNMNSNTNNPSRTELNPLLLPQRG